MTRPANPGKQAFWNDMNRHRNAEYRCVDERYILELESYPSGVFKLYVWEAVKNAGEYLHGTGGNGYVWDAVGEAEFETREEGRDALADLTSGFDVREWCQRNPYDGPRTSWAEREREADL